VETLIYLDGIWSTVPFSILVLFAGLQVVPREPIESAIVDGANWVRQIWHIVLPYLRPQFAFIGLISIMDGFRVFDSVLIMTSQNSAYVSSVLTYNFRVAVSYEQLGKASAINNITVLIIMVLMVPLLLWTYRQQLEAA
jgi:ABC-type sugar transport system permease subunit